MAVSADWLEDMLILLATLGIGVKASIVETDWGLFRDGRPAGKQSKVIQLTRLPSQLEAENIPALRRYAFQVMVIADRTDPGAGLAKGEAIYNNLAGRLGLTASTGRVFDWIRCTSLQQLAGVDENGNFLYSSSYEVQIREGVA